MKNLRCTRIFLGVLPLFLFVCGNTHAANLFAIASCQVSGTVIGITDSSTANAACAGYEGQGIAGHSENLYFPSSPVGGGQAGLIEIGLQSNINILPAIPFGYAGYSLRAGYGSLGVRTSASVASNWINSANVVTSASALVESQDKITIISSTLEYGSPVDVELRWRLMGNMSNRQVESPYIAPPTLYGGSILSAHISLSPITATGESYNAAVCTWSFMLPGCALAGVGSFAPNFTNFADVRMTLLVGHEYNFRSSFASNSFYSLDPQFDDASIFLAGTTHASSLNSLHTYLNAVSDEYYIESESGHDYSFTVSPVPEPAGYLTVTLGLFAVGILARRREARFTGG